MVQIENVDFFDMVMILVKFGNGDLTDMLLSILPKEFKFSDNDIELYEDQIGKYGMSAHIDDKNLEDTIHRLKEEGILRGNY